MKKLMVLMMAALLVAVSLTGCSENAFALNKVEAAEGVPATITAEIENLNLHEKGYFIFDSEEYDTGDSTFILIAGGEKRTGGYDIEVLEKQLNDDTLVVDVEEHNPEDGSMVIQVITYPYVLFKTDATFTELDIENAEGDAFEPLELGAADNSEPKNGILPMDGSHTVTGQYVGMADPHTIEVDIDEDIEWEGRGQNMSFQITDALRDSFDKSNDEYLGLTEGDKVLFKVIKNDMLKNDNDQWVIFHIAKAE